MKDLTVSVIIPCKNAELYIEECIQSVLNQTYKYIEVIVINDGSSDRTGEILRSFGEKIRVINNQKSIGSGPARNLGMMVVSGRYYSFCDSDDVWYADKIESQMDVMLSENSAVCCSGYDLIDEAGRVTRRVEMPDQKVNKKYLEQYGNCVICSTVVVDKKICGLQFFSNHLVEDYLLWMRLTNSYGQFSICRKNLVGYRIVCGSKSNNKTKMMAMHWNILRNWCRFSVFKSSICFIKYCYRCARKYGIGKSISMAV